MHQHARFAVQHVGQRARTCELAQINMIMVYNRLI